MARTLYQFFARTRIWFWWVCLFPALQIVNSGSGPPPGCSQKGGGFLSTAAVWATLGRPIPKLNSGHLKGYPEVEDTTCQHPYSLAGTENDTLGMATKTCVFSKPRPKMWTPRTGDVTGYSTLSSAPSTQSCERTSLRRPAGSRPLAIHIVQCKRRKSNNRWQNQSPWGKVLESIGAFFSFIILPLFLFFIFFRSVQGSHVDLCRSWAQKLDNVSLLSMTRDQLILRFVRSCGGMRTWEAALECWDLGETSKRKLGHLSHFQVCDPWKLRGWNLLLRCYLQQWATAAGGNDGCRVFGGVCCVVVVAALMKKLAAGAFWGKKLQTPCPSGRGVWQTGNALGHNMRPWQVWGRAGAGGGRPFVGSRWWNRTHLSWVSWWNARHDLAKLKADAGPLETKDKTHWPWVVGV